MISRVPIADCEKEDSSREFLRRGLARRQSGELASGGRVVAFVGYCAAVGAAFSVPLWNLLKLALESDEYTHTLIILPLSVVLIVLERDRIFRSQDVALWPAIGWCVASAFLALLSLFLPVYRLTLLIASLVGFWISLFVFFFGMRSFRAASFPLLLAFLFVPIPKPILNAMVSLLQQGSAWVAFHFLQLSGVPVARDHLILFLPGLNIEVAAECSGIRSSLVLFVTTLVIAHLFLRRVWKQVLTALLVIPITILKNGFRIFVLSFWGVTVSPSIFTSWIHRNGGVIFFLMGLSLILLVIWLLQKVDTPLEPTAGKLRKAAVGGC